MSPVRRNALLLAGGLRFRSGMIQPAVFAAAWVAGNDAVPARLLAHVES